MTSKSIEYHHLKHLLLNRNCVAIVFQKEKSSISNSPWKSQITYHDVEDGFSVFEDFVRQNSMCFWNQCLVKSVSSLEYKGCIVPLNVIVGGTEFILEVVRSAWARRVLRPPKGYAIIRLGDMSVLEMHPVPQTQFAPLSEALCKVVVELNSENIPATASTVSSKLADNFPKMEVPSDEILYKTLGGLIKERKLYHTGKGYFVVSPETYRQRSFSPLCERQMLMTNEEAIVRLHGEQKERTLAVQVNESDIPLVWPDVSSSPTSSCKRNYFSSTSSSSPINHKVLPPSPDLRIVERRHSLRVFKVKNRPVPEKDTFFRSNSLRETSGSASRASSSAADSGTDGQKNEKQSMFSKFFRRMQSLTEKSNKHVTFSSQFPSMTWLDYAPVNCQSVGTQTHPSIRKTNLKPEERKSLCIESSPRKSTWYQPVNSREKMMADYSNTMSMLRNSAAKDSPEKNKLKINDSRKVNSPFMRSNAYRGSPSHRHSYAAAGNYAKRHHRHRRSSSESPKIDKMKRKDLDTKDKNDSPLRDVITSSSNPKHTQSFLGGNVKISNPKAIISPCSVVYKSQSSPRQFPSQAIVPHRVVPARPCDDDTLRENDSKPSLNNICNKNIKQSNPETLKNVSPLTGAKICLEVRPVKCQNVSNPVVTIGCKNDSGRSETEDTETRGTSDTSSDIKFSLSDSNFEIPVTLNASPRINKSTPPIVESQNEKKSEMKNDSLPHYKKTTSKEVTIDNCVNVEVTVEKIPKLSSSIDSKSPSSTTLSQTVTEETTITQSSGDSKVVTVTNITTSLSHGAIKEMENSSPETNDDISENLDNNKVNNLNFENAKSSSIFDCTSSCNIVTEVK